MDISLEESLQLIIDYGTIDRELKAVLAEMNGSHMHYPAVDSLITESIVGLKEEAAKALLTSDESWDAQDVTNAVMNMCEMIYRVGYRLGRQQYEMLQCDGEHGTPAST